MNLEVQNKLKENPNNIKYIRENSHWYKTLNRYPERINELIDEMKEKYHIRLTDKIDSAVSTIDIITKIIDLTK